MHTPWLVPQQHWQQTTSWRCFLNQLPTHEHTATAECRRHRSPHVLCTAAVVTCQTEQQMLLLIVSSCVLCTQQLSTGSCDKEVMLYFVRGSTGDFNLDMLENDAERMAQCTAWQAD